MNLKMAICAGCGLITVVAGGCLIFIPGESSEDIPAGPLDTVIPDIPRLELAEDAPPLALTPSPTPGKVMMVTDGTGDREYYEVTRKYRKHFDKKIHWFVSSSGLAIPRRGARPEIYRIWSKRKDELVQRFNEEFGARVGYGKVRHDNIEGALRHALFDLCAGGDNDRKDRHCMVDEGDILDDVVDP